MLLEQILEVIPLKLVSKAGQEKQPVSAAFVSDILSDVMAKAPRHSIWITNQTHENVIAIAFFKELTAVVFTNGLLPGQESIDKANIKNIALYTVDLNAFDMAGRLYAMGIRGSH